MPHLLVTGFGPFPLVPRNPSAALARAIAASPRWRLRGIEARSRILTVAYASLPGELDAALAEGPAAVLMVGVAARSRPVQVERRATARRSTLFPDAAGRTAARPALAGQERERRTRVAPEPALLSLRRQGLLSRISHDAGRYLCNAAYYRALAVPAPVLFIHVPLPPREGQADWQRRLVAALVEIALAMLRAARVAGTRRLG